MTRTIVTAVLITSAALAAACKPESSRRASQAATEAVEEREDLVGVARQLPERPNVVEAATDVVVEAGELAEAARKFAREKQRRLALLRANHDIIATQGGVIAALARDLPITDAARGDINEKLTRFQTRLDEAANLIEGLAKTAIDAWESRDAEVIEAMDRLDDARRDAWDALADAPQIDRRAS